MYVFRDLHSLESIIYVKYIVIYDNSKKSPTERLKKGFNNCSKYTSVNHRALARKRGEARRPQMSEGKEGQSSSRRLITQPPTGVGRSPPLRNKGEGRGAWALEACTTRTHPSTAYLIERYYITTCMACHAHARGCLYNSPLCSNRHGGTESERRMRLPEGGKGGRAHEP